MGADEHSTRFEMDAEYGLHILLAGGLIVLAMLVRAAFDRIGVPPLVGYFGLGLLVRAADVRWGLLGEAGMPIFEFLAMLGVIALLFRIGLESRLAQLFHLLPRASLVWILDVTASAGAGYLAARHLLALEVIPSLFVAVAMSATSVGISTAIWREEGLLDRPDGELMLDVAEMDDVSSVVLMALLFALAPSLHVPGRGAVLPLVAETIGLFSLRIVLFTAFCLLFTRYLEEPLTDFFDGITGETGTMLVVVGLGIMVAAGAELIGFSVAIGAFFAGLIFSRDPDAVRYDASFEAIHDLLVPFFFVGIGLRVDPSVLGAAWTPVLVLTAAAVLGKLIGGGGGAGLVTGRTGALMLGVSMIPRAEIALVVMERGLRLGPWAVPPDLFAQMVVVSVITAVGVPLVLRPLLRRHSPPSHALAS